MKKRQNLLLRGFGSKECPMPSADRLAEWAGMQKKVSCDLISYFLECQIKDQTGSADIYGCAGEFYKTRIFDALSGVLKPCGSGEDSFRMTDEPYADSAEIADDSARIRRMLRGKSVNSAYFTFPSVTDLNIRDEFCGGDQFMPSLCEVYKILEREQRDSGAAGHVICGSFSEGETDELAGNKVSFISPDGDIGMQTLILEYQKFTAVRPDMLDDVFSLMNEYDIKKIFVIDGTPDDFERCLDYFDYDCIFSAGYPDKDMMPSGREYWEELKKKSYLMR